MRKVLLTKCLLAFLILALGGCFAVSARQKAAPVPAPVAAWDGATFHYALGILHSLNEDMEKAIGELEVARRLDPSSPYLAKELASLSAGRGETEKALATSNKTLKEHPDDVDIRLLLGGLYLTLKDSQLAVREYRKVVELAAANTTAYF